MTRAFSKVPTWTEAAERALGASLGDDRAELVRQVNAGIAELWRIGEGTYMVTRIESPAGQRPELVVCCLGGAGLREIVPRLKNAARAQGLRGIRAHVQRPGMVRLLAPFGFRDRERVLFAEV